MGRVSRNKQKLQSVDAAAPTAESSAGAGAAETTEPASGTDIRPTIETQLSTAVKEMERAQADHAKAVDQQKAAQDRFTYWRGRAESLRDLLSSVGTRDGGGLSAPRGRE